MIIDLKKLGKRCKQYRIDIGYTQYDVADDIGYTSENISAFETGRNDNARILMWYILHGLNFDDLKEV